VYNISVLRRLGREGKLSGDVWYVLVAQRGNAVGKRRSGRCKGNIAVPRDHQVQGHEVAEERTRLAPYSALQIRMWSVI